MENHQHRFCCQIEPPERGASGTASLTDQLGWVAANCSVEAARGALARIYDSDVDAVSVRASAARWLLNGPTSQSVHLSGVPPHADALWLLQ